MDIPAGWIMAHAFAEHLEVTRQRVHQLIRAELISPAPRRIMLGESKWVYFIDPKAKVLPSGKKRGGRKKGSKNKPLDIMKVRA
jgi:hypothetical protein